MHMVVEILISCTTVSEAFLERKRFIDCICRCGGGGANRRRVACGSEVLVCFESRC